jgi:hypothetical protein
MSAIISLNALLILEGNIPSATDTEPVPVAVLFAAVVSYLPKNVPAINLPIP